MLQELTQTTLMTRAPNIWLKKPWSSLLMSKKSSSTRSRPAAPATTPVGPAVIPTGHPSLSRLVPAQLWNAEHSRVSIVTALKSGVIVALVVGRCLSWQQMNLVVIKHMLHICCSRCLVLSNFVLFGPYSAHFHIPFRLTGLIGRFIIRYYFFDVFNLDIQKLTDCCIKFRTSYMYDGWSLNHKSQLQLEINPVTSMYLCTHNGF